jgi:hypothetical protein
MLDTTYMPDQSDNDDRSSNQDRKDTNLLKDIEAVQQIPIVPTMLEVICQTTGMGFAAIARVPRSAGLLAVCGMK